MHKRVKDPRARRGRVSRPRDGRFRTVRRAQPPAAQVGSRREPQAGGAPAYPVAAAGGTI